MVPISLTLDSNVVIDAIEGRTSAIEILERGAAGEFDLAVVERGYLEVPEATRKRAESLTRGVRMMAWPRPFTIGRSQIGGGDVIGTLSLIPRTV